LERVADAAPDTFGGAALVRAEIVHDDDVSPGSERRHQHLLDIGPETHAINWAVDDAGRAMRPCRRAARKVFVRQGGITTSQPLNHAEDATSLTAHRGYLFCPASAARLCLPPLVSCADSGGLARGRGTGCAL
jgi:hypothetical protein